MRVKMCPEKDLIEENYQKIIKEILRCDPIPAKSRKDGHIEPPWEVIKRIRIQRNNLESTARLLNKNAEFYKGLLVEIGEMFGIVAKVSDDGFIHEDVLVLKVPELVRTMLQKMEKSSEN